MKTVAQSDVGDRNSKQKIESSKKLEINQEVEVLYESNSSTSQFVIVLLVIPRLTKHSLFKLNLKDYK